MNKKIYNEDLILNLIVNGDKVNPGNTKLLQDLYKLDDATRKLQLANAGLELEKRKLNSANAQDAARIAQITRLMKTNQTAIDSNHIAMQNLRKQIGMMGLTVNQLNAYLKVLKIQLNNASDPKIMKQLQREISEANIRLTTLTTGAGRLSQAWTRLAREANKYSAAIGWISMAVFGVSTAVSNLVQRLSGLDRKLSEVMKTTGMTREETMRLKREYDTMGTPTSTDDLLDMAKIAGRLGITGVDNIRNFTGAVNVLYTALGSDLNLSVEETTEKVGKLVNAFRVTDKMPIEEALLRTGSLLNQLDKSSVASAGTILEYMTRLSSLGTTANYPMEKIAGLAAAMETVNIPAERGSTALRNIISGLGKYADKFSRILGVDIKAYTEMVNKDINGVFLKLIELTAKGDTSIIDIVKSMGDFEVSGVRVAEVYGAIAKNLDIIKTQQDIATEAFKSSASVMAEYNIIINDFKGSIEMQEKRVRRLADEFRLGLQPAAFSVYKLWIDFIYALKDLSGWIGQHIKGIAAIGVGYVTLKAAKISEFIYGMRASLIGLYRATLYNIKAVIAHNSVLIAYQRHGIRGAIIALKTLWTTMLASPIAPFIALIGVAAVAWLVFSKNVSVAAKAIGNFVSEMGRQQREMDKMFKIAEQSAIGTDKHAAAIKALNEVYGKYLPKLLTEKDGIDAVRKARELATEALRKEIAMKWAADEFADYETKQLELLGKISKKILSGKEGADLGFAMGGLENLRAGVASGAVKPDFASAEQYARDYGLLSEKDIAAGKREGSTGAKVYQTESLIVKFMQGVAELTATQNSFKDVILGFTGKRATAADLQKYGFGGGIPGMPQQGTYTVPGSKPWSMMDNLQPTPVAPIMTTEDYEKQKGNAEYQNTLAETALKSRNLTKEAYDAAALQQEMAYINAQIAIEQAYVSQSPKVLADLENTKAGIVMRMREAGLKDKKEENTAILALEKQYGFDQVKIKTRYLEGEIATEDEYNDELLKLELTFLGDKLKNIEVGSEEYLKVYNELLEKKVAVEKSIEEKIIAAQKQFARIKTDRIVNEIEKSLNLENDRWEEEKKGLESQLIQKKELNDKEVQLNDIIHKIIEAKAQEHQNKLKNINSVGDSAEIAKLESALQALDQIGSNTTFINNDRLQQFYDEKKKIIEKQYADEKKMAGDNQEELQKAESHYDKQNLKLKLDIFDAEKKMNEAKIQMAQSYIAALRNVVGEQTALGKALYILGQGLAIADVWIKTAGTNAMIYSTALAEFAVLGPAAPAAAAAWAAAPIASNNAFAALNTGLILAQTIGEVTQYASGRYPVVGADDGQRYMAEWRGEARTGIYRTPSLVAEKGPEMIIDYPTLRNMQMNAPGLVDAIMASRVGQYAAGRYADQQVTSSKFQVSSSGASGGITNDVLNRVAMALENNERQMARVERWNPSIAIETYERKKVVWEKTVNGGLK